MNLNLKQVMAISIAILGVLMISSANLTDLFGPRVSKTIVSAAAMLNSMLGATLAVITGQAQQVKDVLAMPGVEKITVNANANQTLASVAMDPKLDNIGPTAQAEAAVTATAKGN